MKKIIQNNRGFTLIELMTVMAIIAILATAIMVSLGVHKKRAEGNKVLTELSGVMQNIYLCIADDGTITFPGSGAICSGPANAGAYGVWPDLGQTDFSYGGDFAGSPWYYSAVSAEEIVCCNSTYGRCEKKDGSECNGTTPLK